MRLDLRKGEYHQITAIVTDSQLKEISFRLRKKPQITAFGSKAIHFQLDTLTIIFLNPPD